MADTWKNFKHFLSVLILFLLFSSHLGEKHSNESEIKSLQVNEQIKRYSKYDPESNEILKREKRGLFNIGVFDSCDPFPCHNQGLCRKTKRTKKYFCECPVEFTGQKCDQPMPPCKYQQCDNLGDCVGTSGTAVLCICENGGTGELCDLKGEGKAPGKAAGETPAGKGGIKADIEAIEEVLTEETKHELVLIFSLVMGVIAILFVCLCLHCCRANAKKVKLRAKYKDKLEDGVVPKDVPPDLLDVSNALLMATFCCGAKSALLKDDDDTEKKSKKEGKDKDKSANSLVGPYRRSSSRSRTRRRTSNNYNDNQDARYPELIDSYGSYEAMSDFNINNSMDYAVENHKQPGNIPSRPRYTRNKDSYDTKKTKTVVKPAICVLSRRHSNSPRKLSKVKPLSTAVHPYPKSKFVTRYFGPSDYGHLKCSPRLKSKYSRYDIDLDSPLIDSNQYTSDTEADSSSSEEELYSRDSVRYAASSRTNNRNTNSNVPILTTASDTTPVCDNSSMLIRRQMTSDQRRANVDCFVKRCDEEFDEIQLPTENKSYSQARIGTLSPDAKKNFCSNNSLTMNDSMLLSGYKTTLTTAFHRANQKQKGDLSADVKMGKTPGYSDLYRDHYRLLSSSLDDGPEVVHPIKGNSFDYKNKHKIHGYDPALIEHRIGSIDNNHLSKYPEENLGVWGMHVEIVDEDGSAKEYIDTLRHQHEDITNESNLNENTKVRRYSSIDLSDTYSSSGGIGNDKNEHGVKSIDGHFIKSFKKDGKTLYYVSKEPLKGGPCDIDEDIEVIPDGKGSIMVINKTESKLDGVEEVGETNDSGDKQES